jgi:hypothetical protein
LLERHASTLRIFGLQLEVELDAGGSWKTLLRRLKIKPNLQDARFEGRLTTCPGPDTDGGCWYIYDGQYEHRLGELSAGDLEDYFVRE